MKSKLLLSIAWIAVLVGGTIAIDGWLVVLYIMMMVSAGWLIIKLFDDE